MLAEGPIIREPGDTQAVHERKAEPAARILGKHLLALTGYTVLTLLLAYPIVQNLATAIPFGGDAWQHIWNLWWVRHALIDLHTSPYHTNLIFYPDGASLYFHTLVLTAGLIGIPLQALGLNLLATYNVLILMSFVLAGYGTFLLCRYLTKHDWASFVGGLVFAFAPYHFAHIIGHLNLTSLQWMPFYVLVLLKATDCRVGRDQYDLRGVGLALMSGALLALNTYTDWLYGIFLAMLTALVVGWRLLVPRERRDLRERGMTLPRAGVRLLAGGGLFLILIGPVLFPTLAEARKGYAQQPAQETLVYSSDLILAFTPSELHPTWGKVVANKVSTLGPYLPIKNPSERVLFLGYTVLALSAFALWKLRRDRAVVFWAVTAFLTWLLSLGPVLQVAGKTRFTAFDVAVPLPYLLLYKLPLFNIMRTPARLTVLTMLALSVLVAFGMTYAMRALQNRVEIRPSLRSAAFALLAPALILFEFLAVPFPMVPPGWGVPIYSKIATEPGNFALLELPLRPFGDYMAYQTVHGKPIIGGYLSRQPDYPTLQREAVLGYLLNTTKSDDPLASEVANGTGADRLRELGVKYVIIRWWAFTPEEKAAMQRKLAVLLNRPPDLTYPSDQVAVWRLFP